MRHQYYEKDSDNNMGSKRIVLQYHLSPGQLENILLAEDDCTGSKNTSQIEDFYEAMENLIKDLEDDTSYRYISIHSTETDESNTQALCSSIKMNLTRYGIPVDGPSLHTTDACVKAFKYLICCTNFKTQPLISDSVSGSLSKDLHPPFSPYLLMKMICQINYDSILSEAILHFPLDLSTEIMEIIPRCVTLMNFERAVQFYTTLITNAYRKLISLTEIGTQTKDILISVTNFSGSLQELIVQFNFERFSKCESKSQKSYEKHGILIKRMLKMVKYSLMNGKRGIIGSCSMQRMYKLEFGNEPIKKLEDNRLQPLTAEIDNVLVSSLLSKVKEIDCNMFMDWIEYDDYEDTSLSLQRAIGVESYSFVKDTSIGSHSHIRQYNHLIECLGQISCQPTPENYEENNQLENLINETKKGNKKALITLFRRYKEWKNEIKNVINNGMSLLDKESIAELFEYFAAEVSRPKEQLDFSRLQLFSLFLTKSLSHLSIADVMDITLNFLVKHKDDENLETSTDIVNFKEFITHNPRFSKTEDLKVVLFFVCFNARSTLEILIKIAIGHSDYAGLCVSFDDMKLLQPIMELEVSSRYRIMMESLRLQNLEEEKYSFFSVHNRSKRYILHTSESCRKSDQGCERINNGIPMAAQVIQNIIVQKAHLDVEKFTCFLNTLFSVSFVPEILNEVSTFFLITQPCYPKFLAYVFQHLEHLKIEDYSVMSMDFIKALEWNAICILKSNDVSKYTIDEILSSIILWAEKLLNTKSTDTFESLDSNYQDVLISFSSLRVEKTVSLVDKISRVESLLQVQLPAFIDYSKNNRVKEAIIRFLLLKCTRKQYCDYLDEMIKSQDQILKCTSKLDVCDKVIHSTIEACLLSLEFPKTNPPHTVSFLIQCLTRSLPLIPVSKRKQKFCAGLCAILYKNIQILELSIKCTKISDAYTKLMNQLREHTSDFKVYMEALNCFAHECMHESENLRAFKGQHSSDSFRILQGYNLINDLLNDREISYESVKNFC